MTTGAPTRPAGRGPSVTGDLAARIRLADGRIYDGPLPAERHQRIHLGVIHSDTDGYVEVAAGARPTGGKVKITTRRDPGHYLPGGRAGQREWIAAILALVARHTAAGEEVFIGPSGRAQPAATKQHVTHTNWLWIDVDRPDALTELWAFLAERPAHVVAESAGSGGVHAYWKLNRPLRAATTVNEQTGEADGPGWLVSPTTTDTIEAAHQRLIYALGYRWVDGVPRPTVADPSCRDRSRVLRLAGTVNYKSARHARILWADLALPAWDLRALIGDLPSPPTPKAPSALPSGGALASDDSYRHIAPADYFQRLAGIEIPASGLVSCPNPGHRDRTPSCHVGRDATAGWYCFGCQAGGGIYDLASVLDGGPTGNWLRAEAFKRARNRVRDVFGTPTPSPTAQHLMPEEAK